MERDPGDEIAQTTGSNLLLLLGLSRRSATAVCVCSLMAVGYVALLYSPALFLPRPKSMRQHMLRRFVCAAVASSIAPIICLKVLAIPRLQWDSDYSALLEIFGVRATHLWQVVALPAVLTAILYLGPLILELVDFIEWCIEDIKISGQVNLIMQHIWSAIVSKVKMLASDVLWWRNFIVAPVSEELVFRACMVPLLLCGGFSSAAVVFLCPLFFALAHVHHFWELVYGQNHDMSTAALIVGLQLGYTTVFGWYATFLYLRTGHLLAPLVAHIFCNSMGLPNIEAAASSQYRRGIILAYAIGLIGFFLLAWAIVRPSSVQ